MQTFFEAGRGHPTPWLGAGHLHVSHATAVACRMGMARRPLELAIAFVAMGALGCSKSKLEATVKGYKPGSSSIVLVHVKGDKGATVDCTPAGLDCARTDLGAAGEADVEIDLLLAGDKPKVVVLHSQIGRRQATATVDFAGSRLGVRFDFAGGSIRCISPTCSGMVSLAPTASLSFTAAPGTTVDIGNEHFKTDAAGELHTPLALTTTPPLKDLQASRLCNHTASPVGKTKLTLTFADGSKGTGDLALTTEMVTSGLAPTLWAIKKGPVLFPWERAGATPRAKRAAFALDLNGCTAFGGPADATLADVVVLVVTAPKGQRADTCTYAITDSSGASRGTSTGRITLFDETAIAYDRVSGKKLAERVFQAPKVCDPNIKLTSASTPIADQSMSPLAATVVAWAATVR